MIVYIVLPRYIVGDMETAVHCMLEHMGWEGDPVTLLTNSENNPMTEGYPDVTQAQTSFVFNVGVLLEMGNAKNNLIGVSLRVNL